MREAGKRCGIGDRAASLPKKRLAAAIVEFFGTDDIVQMLGGLARSGNPTCGPAARSTCAVPPTRVGRIGWLDDVMRNLHPQVVHFQS